jgi:hypothetical protein
MKRERLLELAGITEMHGDVRHSKEDIANAVLLYLYEETHDWDDVEEVVNQADAIVNVWDALEDEMRRILKSRPRG